MPSVSPAPTPVAVPFEIESTLGGCLDTSSSSVGTDLYLQNCDSSDNQKWLQAPNGNFFSALDNSKCIGVEGNSYSSGTPIEVQDCVSGSTDQEWTYEADGTVKSVANPSYCWDSNGLSGVVYLWTCDGTSDQYWIFNNLTPPPPPPPTVSPAPTATATAYEIESTLGGCLDASSSSVGTDLYLETCDSSDNQKWLQTPNGNFFSALDPQKCIGVEGNSYSSGTPIEVQDCVGGSTDQEWTYESDGTVKSVANPSY